MKKLFLFLSIIFFSNAVYVDYAMNDTNGQSLQEKLATNSQQYFKQAKQEQTTKQQKIITLEVQVQQLTQQLKEENEKNAKYQNTINQLKNTTNQLKSELQSMIDLIVQHDNNTQQLTQVKTLTQKIKNQNQQNDKLQQGLTEENTKLQDENDKLNRENSEKDAKITELEKLQQEQQQQKQELDKQLQQILEQLQQLITTLPPINNDQQQTTSEQIQQNDQNQPTIIQLITQQIQTLEQPIKDQKKANQEKDNQIQQLKQENDALKQNNQNLKDKIKQPKDQQQAKDISKVNTVFIKNQINKMINNNAKSAEILKILINSQELIDINYFITANNLMIILIPNTIISQTNLEPTIYNLSTSLDNVAHADTFMSELMRICSTPSDMPIIKDVSSPAAA